jgi:RNA polymerase sigma-70 factor, ECF subfamily
MLDEKEFAAIVKRTKGVVLSAVREHLPFRFGYVIDDISQETYFRAYKSLEKNGFRNESSIETWLYVIARNETLRAVSRLVREERKAEKAAESIKDSAPAEDTVDTEMLSDLIAKLSDSHRNVFRLLAAGKSEKEISGELGIPRGTVKSRISRGRIELRRLREEGIHE